MFVSTLVGWLLTGVDMLLATFAQPPQPYAFLHPSTGKPFTVSSFCYYFKKHLKRVSGVDISPGKLRCACLSLPCVMLCSRRHVNRLTSEWSVSTGIFS